MAAPRITDSRKLDVAAFAAAGGELSGTWPQRELARLAAAAVVDDRDGDGNNEAATVRWYASGVRTPLEGAGVQPALRLVADTEVTLECQRCLQPMTVPLHVERRLFFVPGEDAAAALDAQSDDDVLALVPSLDLQALVEDELLLALPLVPRHEACALPLPAVSGEAAIEASSEHPFAALAALKGRTLPN